MVAVQQNVPEMVSLGWHWLRRHVLTLRLFDLKLQGSLLSVVLLNTYCTLLLRREAGTLLIRARAEDWVSLLVALTQPALGGALAWTGRRRRPRVLAAVLALTGTVGLLLLAVPFPPATVPQVELCGDSEQESTWHSLESAVTKNATASTQVVRIALLVLTLMLCALSQISVWALGLTYLDDHQPHDGPYFYGILISIQLSLGLGAASWLQASALGEDWRIPLTALAAIVLAFGFLLSLYSHKMPHQLGNDDQDNKGFRSSLWRILQNRAVLLQTLALALLSTALFGFVLFDDDFVQARFHVEAVRQDPRTSRVVGDIFRSLVIIFFVMIFRVRFSVRRADGVKGTTAAMVGGVTAVVVAASFAVLATLDCNVQELQGLQETPPACSSNCGYEQREHGRTVLPSGCESARYGFSSVCDLDSKTTFFSPCIAGCRASEDLNGLTVFYNCTCTGGDMRAVRGSCNITSCSAVFAAYQIIYTVMVAVSAASLLMQGMAVLRTVRRGDKPLAIGAAVSVTALVHGAPGRWLYVVISNAACVYEGVSGAGAACVFHAPTLRWLAVVSAVLSLASAVASIAASLAARLIVHNSTNQNTDNNRRIN